MPPHRNSRHNEEVRFHNHLCCWDLLHLLSSFLPFLDCYLKSTSQCSGNSILLNNIGRWSRLPCSQGFLGMLPYLWMQQSRGDKWGGQLKLMWLPPRTQSTRLRMYKVLLFKFRRHSCKGSTDELVSEQCVTNYADQCPGDAVVFLTGREVFTGRILAQVLTVQIECSEFRTKNTKGQYYASTVPIIDWKKIAKFQRIFWLEDD